ncbi:Hypothetical protein HEAR3111 [Herminiimonas arsenicoxydans]|uniref:TonB C-terminal domain-containing protein n=1 Tax=Herminiimonas arsenicoxydans TaxID=204773 RepID=A4G9N3_HERAR|nr:Hypothetical protein HEAR3111 [Herminiimonas arsenicoxydans]
MQVPQRQYPCASPKTVTVIALLLTVSAHIFFLRFWLDSTSSKPATQNVLVALTANPLQKNPVRKNILNPAKSGDSEPQVESDAQQDRQNIEPPTIEPSSENKTYYFKYDEVSSKPVVITDIPADFSLPVLADLSQTLVLTLRISDKGEIDEVLIDSKNLDENARESVINAFKTMRFEAARINDISVPSEIRIEAQENELYTTQAIE